jgi:hypothetical protein
VSAPSPASVISQGHSSSTVDPRTTPTCCQPPKLEPVASQLPASCPRELRALRRFPCASTAPPAETPLTVFLSMTCCACETCWDRMDPWCAIYLHKSLAIDRHPPKGPPGSVREAPTIPVTSLIVPVAVESAKIVLERHHDDEETFRPFTSYSLTASRKATLPQYPDLLERHFRQSACKRYSTKRILGGGAAPPRLTVFNYW